MKRNFAAGVLGGVIGAAVVLMLMTAVGWVGAQGQSDRKSVV
jgi:hypothetical protein